MQKRFCSELGAAEKQDSGAGSEKLLTKADVANICQGTPWTVNTWIRGGTVTYFKLGRTVRFRLSDLLAHCGDTCRVSRRTPIN